MQVYCEASTSRVFRQVVDCEKENLMTKDWKFLLNTKVILFIVNE